MKFMMNILISIIAVLIPALLAIGIAASQSLAYVLIVIAPYVVFVIFLSGFAYRIIKWGRVPVPFRIPTTCGQEKSLPWI
ncbi:MAG TPA: menaquinol oxidoreductase, partial [Syntrophaceae bacterium]|nr:menaquinol oxidoreductase [Syntrophaceae bacterium]